MLDHLRCLSARSLEGERWQSLDWQWDLGPVVILRVRVGEERGGWWVVVKWERIRLGFISIYIGGFFFVIVLSCNWVGSGPGPGRVLPKTWTWPYSLSDRVKSNPLRSGRAGPGIHGSGYNCHPYPRGQIKGQNNISTWKIKTPLFSSNKKEKIGVLRGYCRVKSPNGILGLGPWALTESIVIREQMNGVGWVKLRI